MNNTPQEVKKDIPKEEEKSSSFIKVPVLRGRTEIEPILRVTGEAGLQGEHGALICGGWARFMCSPRLRPTPAGDVDIYCPSQKAHDTLLTAFKEAGLEVRFDNNLAVTFKRPQDGPFAFSPIVQLIKPITEGAIVATGAIEEILSNFDFTVIRLGLLPGFEEALADPDFLEDEAKRVLVIKNIHCPVSSLLRCLKYGRKGYYMAPSQALRLFIDWDRRTDEYRERIITLFQESVFGEMSQEAIDELESLLRID